MSQQELDNQNHHVIFKVVVGVLILTCLGLIGINIHQDHQQQSIHNKIRQERVDTKNTNQQTKDLKPVNIDSNYDKTHDNLSDIEYNNKKALNIGLNLAYTRCTTTSNFNNNKAKVNQALGNQLGKKVLSVVQPQQNQAFIKPTSISNKIANTTISYGRYSSTTHTLPISIIVKYRTPKFNTDAGSGTGNNGKKTSHVGFTMINGTLSTNNNQISNISCTNQVLD